jgi:hypothetical protein
MGWCLLVLLALVLPSKQLWAIYTRTDVQEVPVNRLVANLERRLDEKPKEVQLLINLARVHAMAYALKSGTVQVERGRETDGPVSGTPANIIDQPAVVESVDPVRLKEAQSHLVKAISRYEQAISLEPANALAQLGYGWTLEQSGTRDKAIAAYRAAITVAWPMDSGRFSRLAGHRSITEEAIRYLIPLLDPVKDKDEIATHRTRAARLVRNPRAVTPVVIPLRDDVLATDLVDTSARVKFDADGGGLQSWTWITRDAGWLVVDPRDNRQVQSGLQLFGNVTFWLFWDNGYEAMRALDDNGDGRLSGIELSGVAIWRDVNANGVSDKGEVVPVGLYHVIELSCAYVREDENPYVLAHSPSGVRFDNGRTRPTYDVVLHAARDPGHETFRHGS